MPLIACTVVEREQVLEARENESFKVMSFKVMSFSHSGPSFQRIFCLDFCGTLKKKKKTDPLLDLIIIIIII